MAGVQTLVWQSRDARAPLFTYILAGFWRLLGAIKYFGSVQIKLWPPVGLDKTPARDNPLL
ncbi:MAG: hypothetical protein DRR08_31700 [Candidatus Parabeggiatoa sp. nov. 2]|nr:MAG: hypothetical protein DRR08_31700 [Gammaproteobacteria bacterium]